MLIRPVGILHICNLWISLRKIVIYLVGFIYFLLLKLTVKVDVNPWICLINPGYFNIQTSHRFENFCLFHQIVPIRFRLEGYIFSMSITACFHYNTDSWVDVTSVNFNSEKVHEDDVFGRQDIFSQTYPKITNMENPHGPDIGTLSKVIICFSICILPYI